MEQVFGYCYEACLRFEHPHVSSGHLLLGILKANRGPAAILEQCGLTVAIAERFWVLHSIRSEQTTLSRALLVGKSVIAVMERAETQARRTECRFIGTDHVLLGLLEEVLGDACDLFDTQKVDRTRLHELLAQRLANRFDFGEFSDIDR